MKKSILFLHRIFMILLLDKVKRCSSNSTIKIQSEEKHRSNTKLFCLTFYRKADSLLITLSHYLRQKIRWFVDSNTFIKSLQKVTFCVIYKARKQMIHSPYISKERSKLLFELMESKIFSGPSKNIFPNWPAKQLIWALWALNRTLK